MRTQGANELTEDEIARRAPVWRALSDLLLDTELQPSDLRAIADTIRRAGYSIAETEAILRDEVAPVLVTNLRSVAGQWAPWSEQFIRDLVLQHLRKVSEAGAFSKVVARVQQRKSSRLIDRLVLRDDSDWSKVKQLLAQSTKESDGGV